MRRLFFWSHFFIRKHRENQYWASLFHPVSISVSCFVPFPNDWRLACLPNLSKCNNSKYDYFQIIEFPAKSHFTVIKNKEIRMIERLIVKMDLNVHTETIKTVPIFTQKLIRGIIYCTHNIISYGLYIFYPIFHCGLYCSAANTTDNLCTKRGNSSIFWPKIRGL